MVQMLFQLFHLNFFRLMFEIANGNYAEMAYAERLDKIKSDPAAIIDKISHLVVSRGKLRNVVFI